MESMSWEVIGAVFLIIGTNFVFSRWNYYTLSAQIKAGDEKGIERDRALDKRIDDVKEERQKCKEEHSAQAVEFFSQLQAQVKSAHDSFCALMEKLSQVATDVAVTKNNINITKVLANKIDQQTEAITNAIKNKKGD